MSNKKQTAVEWFYDKIKSHFEHDGDLLETSTFTFAIAKQKEREQAKRDFLNGYKGGLKPMNHDVIDKFINDYYKEEKQ